MRAPLTGGLALVALGLLAWTCPAQHGLVGAWYAYLWPGHCLVWSVPDQAHGSVYIAPCEPAP